MEYPTHEQIDQHTNIPDDGSIKINIPHGGVLEVLEAASPLLINWVGPSTARVKKKPLNLTLNFFIKSFYAIFWITFFCLNTLINGFLFFGGVIVFLEIPSSFRFLAIFPILLSFLWCFAFLFCYLPLSRLCFEWWLSSFLLAVKKQKNI